MNSFISCCYVVAISVCHIWRRQGYISSVCGYATIEMSLISAIQEPHALLLEAQLTGCDFVPPVVLLVPEGLWDRRNKILSS